MAQRRMFSKSITNSSRFLMMPQSAQNLYFHLGMNADDDGFCEHFTIMRMTESKPDDLKILQAKRFIHIFDDRVLVIMEWKENNHIQKDRYTPSKYLKTYKNEIKMLSEGRSGVSKMDTKWIQNGYKMDTQDRIGKGRLGKSNILTAEQVGGKQVLDDIELLTDYFIALKGTKEHKSRYFRAAGELLTLCDGNLDEAKVKIVNLKEWAEKEGMEWELDTAIKRFLTL